MSSLPLDGIKQHCVIAWGLVMPSSSNRWIQVFRWALEYYIMIYSLVSFVGLRFYSFSFCLVFKTNSLSIIKLVATFLG